MSLERVTKGRAEIPVTINEEVIDCDAHIRESVEDLLPYIDDEEIVAYAKGRNPYPSDGWDRSAGGRNGSATVRTPEDELAIMEDLSLDISLITPTRNLHHGEIVDVEMANAFAAAYNDYMLDVWLDGYDELVSGILAPVQDPEFGAAEIDRLGDEDGMVGVFLNPAGSEKALGDERYHPIYEAAERNDLPIVMHSVATTNVGFPLQTNYFHKFVEVHSISHSFQQMAQVASILCRGVPAKYPDLRFVCLEAGLSWLPFLYRLDTEVLSRPNETPLLDKRPTEYFTDQFWVSCQPIEEIRGFPGTEFLAEFAGGWDRIVFSSDWPHWDFDSPTVVNEYVPQEYRTKVWSENARAAFDL